VMDRFEKEIHAAVDCAWMNSTGLPCPMTTVMVQGMNIIAKGVPELSHLLETNWASIGTPVAPVFHGGSRPVAPSGIVQLKWFGNWASAASMYFWINVVLLVIHNLQLLNLLTLTKRIYRTSDDLLERSVAAHKQATIEALATVVDVYPSFDAFRKVNGEMSDAELKELENKVCRGNPGDSPDHLKNINVCWDKYNLAVEVKTPFTWPAEAVFPIVILMILFGSQIYYGVCDIQDATMECSASESLLGAMCIGRCIHTNTTLSFSKHGQPSVYICGNDGNWHTPKANTCQTTTLNQCYSSVARGVVFKDPLGLEPFATVQLAMAACDTSIDCIGVGWDASRGYLTYKMGGAVEDTLTASEQAMFYFKGGCGHRFRTFRLLT